MKKIINFFKARSKYFKGIFMVTVVVIIFFELTNLTKTLDFHQLKIIFRDLPRFKLILMAVIGFVAILPMLGYDIIFHRMLKRPIKTSYLLETSWITNTINNLTGFGGFVSVGFRSAFYGGKKEGPEFLHALSKVFLFLMSGLSFYSLLSFLLVSFGQGSPYLHQYWPLLLGGGLYFPVIILVTHLKKTGILGGMPLKTAIALMAVSILEWTGVLASFLSIAYFLDIHVPYLQVIPLVIAASVFGVITMLPGEIGSFDVMMFMGLATFGIPRETIAVWILLFRLFYYILPFLLGILLFAKNLSGRFNQRFEGLPRDLAEELAHKILVFLLYSGGIILALSGTIPRAFTELSFLRQFNPFTYHLLSKSILLILGYFLILMGRGVSARVKRTYPFAILFITLSLAYTILLDFSLGAVLYFGILLLIMLFSKQELFRKQLVYSWEMRLVDFFILGFLTLLYIFIGVYNRPDHPLHRHRLPTFFVFPSERLWLIGFIGILIVAFFMILLIHYLEQPRKKIAMPYDENRITNLLMTQGGNTDSQLVFLGDKDTYFYRQDDVDLVLFQYRIKNDKLIIMGNPAGDASYFEPAIEELIDVANRQGYKLVFYEVTEELVMILHNFGYDFFKMGEAAEVNLLDFSLTGKKRKAERALMNRFNREEYSFEIVQPPFDSQLLTRLKEISDEWLAGRSEKGFSMGFFNESYLKREPIALVKNSAGTIVAFANLIPSYESKKASVDLMRYDKTVVSGIMDYLFIQLFEYLKAEGYEKFDLGMAPLANVGTTRHSFFQERIAYLIFHFGSRFYSFQGLREYKDKYASAWIPKYTLYCRDSSIIFSMIQLLLVDNAPVKNKTTHPLQKFMDWI